MGFVGKVPAEAALTSDDITDGAIVNADINASAAIAMSKTAFSAGTGVTLSTNTLNVDAAQTGITSLLATDIKIGEDDQTKIDFEDANKINFYANNAKEVELAENSLSPGTSDGTALGTTSLMWSDLFLASGSVINFNNGDVTLTHSGNTLTVAGGTLATATITASTSIDITGSTGLILENDETITNSTNGTVLINGIVAGGTGSGAGVFQSNGDHDVTLQTGNSTTGTITITDGANGDVAIAPNGTGKLTSTGDIDVFRDANDADVALRLGTAAAESLTIQVLNGGSNKTAEEVHFSSATASATGDHGKMVFDVDGTDILTIDDGGLVIKTTGTIGPVGDEDLLTLTASGSIVTVAGELSVTTLDIGGTNVTATAAELNLLDGGTSVGGSITLADADGVVVNDGGTMKTIPASDIKTYASGGGGTFDAVANGAISAGALVGIGTDGKVKTLTAISRELNDMCTNSIPDTETSLYDGSSSTVRGLTAVYDPDNSKGMLVWHEYSSPYDLLAAVLTLNTTTGAITIGSTSIIHNGTSSQYPNYSMGYPALTYDTTADRFFLMYALTNTSGSSYRSFRGIVLDIDGTSVVSGTEQVIRANTTGGWAARKGGAAFMTGRGHVGIFYNRTSYSGDGGSLDSSTRGRYVDILTLDNSDNSFTTESSTRVSTTTSGSIAGAWDSDTGRFLVVGLDSSDDLAYQVVEHDNSDDSLTAGSETAWNTDAQGTTAFKPYYWASAQKMAVVFSVGASQDTSSTPNGTYLQLIAIASSGQTATVSSNRTTLRTERQNHDKLSVDIFEPTTGNMDNMLVVTYTDYSGSTGYLDTYEYVSSGVTVQVGVDAETISTDVKETEGMVIISNGKGVSLLFIENSDTSQIEYTTPSLTFTTPATDAAHPGRWIGIANDAISDTATGTITSIGGVGTGQSSLTVGSMYAISSSGTLSEQSTFYGDVSYANVGVALTASTIFITGGIANG